MLYFWKASWRIFSSDLESLIYAFLCLDCVCRTSLVFKFVLTIKLLNFFQLKILQIETKICFWQNWRNKLFNSLRFIISHAWQTPWSFPLHSNAKHVFRLLFLFSIPTGSKQITRNIYIGKWSAHFTGYSHRHGHHCDTGFWEKSGNVLTTNQLQPRRCAPTLNVNRGSLP